MKNILWFKELSIKDVPKVGGKNASLGEMYNKLTSKGISVPNGFAVSAGAYRKFLKANGLEEKINSLIKKIDFSDFSSLKRETKNIRDLILRSEFPPEVKKDILQSYGKLSKENKTSKIDVAVRSSATAEDLPVASFAGQLESYLNIKGEDQLLMGVKKCFSSLFSERVASYVHDQGFTHKDISLAVGVQRMVRSDKAASGVMFTLDTESGFKDAVLINSSWGLGENIVKGRVTPDEFIVFKPLLGKAPVPIIKKNLGSKKKKLIYKGHGTVNVNVKELDRGIFSLDEKEILRLAGWGVKIEEHYKRPMDIEWAKDGRTGELFIVQSRPETIYGSKKRDEIEEYIMLEKGKVLCKGEGIGEKIGQGEVQVIKDVKDIAKFKKGKVLVTRITDPDWEPIMKIASAIITEAGGRTSHAAIVSRELGIPCVVGTGNATSILKNGREVTANCSDGNVYADKLKYKIKKTRLSNVKKIKTKIMMNIGNPREAFMNSFIPNDGVGLARIEFIINDYIKAHPLALLDPQKAKPAVRKAIKKMTSAYKSGEDFFVNNLAYGVAQIAAAFYPKDVIVRFSDFKSNEYASLLGGDNFEPKEENPMIGWRGASRYYDEKFRPVFEMECRAIAKVRNEMRLDNVKVMVPFCRTLEEGKNVLKIIKGNIKNKKGLKELQTYVMVEIPANVVLADEFAKIFDGFSIGSNDLTQLTLGVDRDSSLVAHVFDERNEAVKILIKRAIAAAKKAKIKIGICGQAPSDFPDFAKFLADEGIDSISLTPDTVIKTMAMLAGKK